MDFSFEGLVIGGHSAHLREESGLAQDRRMAPTDNRHAPQRRAPGNILLCEY